MRVLGAGRRGDRGDPKGDSSWSSSSSTGSTPCRRTPRQRSWRPGERPLRAAVPGLPGRTQDARRRRIGLDRTAVPVELDRISQSLDDLLVALGPQGANEEGAFSRLLATGADNLEGQGQAIHDSNRDLSRALETLSGGRNDLFGTVKNLQSFTSMLATNDQQVRRLNKDLATVSTQLDGSATTCPPP